MLSLDIVRIRIQLCLFIAREDRDCCTRGDIISILNVTFFGILRYTFNQRRNVFSKMSYDRSEYEKST
jgi:hypothetical protein